MRVILDTNVLLSALIRVDSPPYKLVHAWLDGRFHLVSCQAQLEELTQVSRYPRVRRYLEPVEVGWLVNRIRDRAVLLRKLPLVDISTDPADNFLFAMAQGGRADFLVTGDKAGVLALEHFISTRIVTVRRMVTTLKLR